MFVVRTWDLPKVGQRAFCVRGKVLFITSAAWACCSPSRLGASPRCATNILCTHDMCCYIFLGLSSLIYVMKGLRRKRSRSVQPLPHLYLENSLCFCALCSGFPLALSSTTRVLWKGSRMLFTYFQELETPCQGPGEFAWQWLWPVHAVWVWGLGRGGEGALVTGRSLSACPGKKVLLLSHFPCMSYCFVIIQGTQFPRFWFPRMLLFLARLWGPKSSHFLIGGGDLTQLGGG